MESPGAQAGVFSAGATGCAGLSGRAGKEAPAVRANRDAAGWLIGLAMSLFGVSLSFKLDVPTAPLIVASLSLVFFILLAFKAIRAKAALGRADEGVRGPVSPNRFPERKGTGQL